MLTFMRIADEYKFPYTFEHATEAIDILDELARRKVAIVVGPTFTVRGKTEVLWKTFATVARAVEAGLTVAVTSDHNVTPMRYLQVFAALAMREGLSEADALKTITIHPATILGVARRLGSIEPGKEADLVIWGGDPLDVRSKPDRVYIRGRLLDVKAARRALFERE
jgi:imidazolonepropionase-like amidohydrolase